MDPAANTFAKMIYTVGIFGLYFGSIIEMRLMPTGEFNNWN